MSEKEFLQNIDLLWSNYENSKSELEYAEYKDRIGWLVSEYKHPNQETANWWKEGLL